MFRVVFHVTEECNMACAYCYERRKLPGHMDFSYAKLIIDEFIKYKLGQSSQLDGFINTQDDKVVLMFIGGEVTLYMDLVEQICDYYYQQCAKYNLVDLFINSIVEFGTNGTTYFEPDVQHFVHKYFRRMEFPITMDGCKECHDMNRRYKDGSPTFDDVESAIKKYIKDFNIIPNTKMTFNARTIQYLLPACQHMYELGYNRIRMSLDTTRKITYDETEQYYQSLKSVIDWIIDNRIEFLPDFSPHQYNSTYITPDCGMSGTQLAIDIYGNLFSCFRYAEASMGDKNMPIGKIENGQIQFYYDIIDYFLKHAAAYTNPKCKDCPIRSACHECPSENVVKNGELFKSFNNCGETVAEARAQLYFIQRAEETDYPYFKDIFEKLNNTYDPNFKYLID